MKKIKLRKKIIKIYISFSIYRMCFKMNDVTLQFIKITTNLNVFFYVNLWSFFCFSNFAFAFLGFFSICFFF